jgi:hypothetical protein
MQQHPCLFHPMSMPLYSFFVSISYLWTQAISSFESTYNVVELSRNCKLRIFPRSQVNIVFDPQNLKARSLSPVEGPSRAAKSSLACGFSFTCRRQISGFMSVPSHKENKCIADWNQRERNFPNYSQQSWIYPNQYKQTKPNI